MCLWSILYCHYGKEGQILSKERQAINHEAAQQCCSISRELFSVFNKDSLEQCHNVDEAKFMKHVNHHPCR